MNMEDKQNSLIVLYLCTSPEGQGSMFRPPYTVTLFIESDNKIYLCTSPEGQGSTFHPLHTAMLFSALVQTLADTGSVPLS